MLQKRALLTLIGVGLIQAAVGIINDWGSVNVYFLTYIHYRMPEFQIDSSTASTFAIIALLPTVTAIFLNNKLNACIGYKNTIVLCGACYFLSGLIALIHFNVYTLIVFCLLIPVLSFGLSIVAIFHCLYSHFLEDRNKVTAYAVIVFGIGAVLWNQFCTRYINPQNEKQFVKDSQGQPLFFSEDVANRVPSACSIITVGGGVLFVIGSLMVSDAAPLKTDEEQQPQQNQQQQKQQQQYQHQSSVDEKDDHYSPKESDHEEERAEMQIKNEISETIAGKENYEIVDDKQEEQKKQLSAILSPTFIILLLIALFGSIYHVYIQLNLKIIYSEKIQDDHFISNGLTALIVSGLIGAAIWGVLGDKLGAVKMILVYCLIDMGVKIFSSLASNKIMFMISMIFLGFTDKAILTLFGPALIEVYGLGRASKLLTYKFMTLVGSMMAASGLKVIFSEVNSQIFLFILLIFSVINIVIGWKLWKLNSV